MLNGEPFMRYALRALYPLAHEIIVVEGAAPDARDAATVDGHSRDETMATLTAFKRDEDPDEKVTILTAEDLGHPDGFWPGEKDEMCDVWTSRATGDYIWQVDVDEFYHPQDIAAIMELFALDPTISMAEIPQIVFWGGFDYRIDGWYYRVGTHSMGPAGRVPRAWRWGPGYSYARHRPPTVIDDQGRPASAGKVLDHRELAKRGIFTYHYSNVFPQQIEDKLVYYSKAAWKKSNPVPGPTHYRTLVWNHVDRNPFRVHFIQEYPSWLSRFAGQHPPEIVSLRNGLADSGSVELRPTEDIDLLLGSLWYRLRRRFWIARTAVGATVIPWRRRFGRVRREYFAAWSRARRSESKELDIG